MKNLAELDFPEFKGKDYEKQLDKLQLALMKYQQALYQTGRRAIIVFEGTDAAGKGGVVRRLIEKMDSRGYRVYSIGPPTPEEKANHYLLRFWQKLPDVGQLVVFDRSWYGRVLVERVEGLADELAWRRAYQELNHFEKLLYDDGVILVKIFLHISKDEQKKRFLSRLNNPEKRWKLTMADLDSRQHWDEYISAYNDMLELTSTAVSPWNIIPANNKKYARIQALKVIADHFEKHLNISGIRLMQPGVEQRAREILHK